VAVIIVIYILLGVDSFNIRDEAKVTLPFLGKGIGDVQKSRLMVTSAEETFSYMIGMKKERRKWNGIGKN